MSIGVTRVEEVMVQKIITVNERDSMTSFAKILEVNDINATPVVDEQGQCIGIVTSHDLVEYEAARAKMMKCLLQNSTDETTICRTSEMFRFPGIHYDEVAFHMSRTLQTASVDDPLSRVARNMCRQHIHHVIVLDKANRPIGMLSSLDLLGFVIDEPVCRSAVCPVEAD